MYDVLAELNKTSGIKGSMMVGADGIIIAADLDNELEDDTVGALAASIIAGIKKAVNRLDRGQLNHVMIEAEHGKVFLSENQFGILVVIADNEVNIGLIRLEMRTALSRIQNSTVITGKS
ncbi:MAG: hypothetical protein GF307_05035 [candidate division Zixibacteria bacterium]|nr:hypothetical protein [candidate division Zixibacteria bacterium]